MPCDDGARPCCYDKLNYLGEPHPVCQCHPGTVRNTDARPDQPAANSNSNSNPDSNPDGDPIPQPVPIAYGEQSPLF